MLWIYSPFVDCFLCQTHQSNYSFQRVIRGKIRLNTSEDVKNSFMKSFTGSPYVEKCSCIASQIFFYINLLSDQNLTVYYLSYDKSYVTLFHCQPKLKREVLMCTTVHSIFLLTTESGRKILSQLHTKERNAHLFLF